MSYHLTEAFEGQVIRISGTPDAPLFCAADVCAVLGHTNTTVALETLDEDERSKVSLGHRGEANYITESGLYHLAFKSRKAAAKRFRRWVTNEVLPAIRKNGAFHADDGHAKLDMQRMPLTKWVNSLGLDLRDDARRCADVLGYVTRAASMLRWYVSPVKGQNAETLFQEVPLPVLKLAEGLYIQGTGRWQITRDTGRLPLPEPVEVMPPEQRIPGGTIKDIIAWKKRQTELAKEDQP